MNDRYINRILTIIFHYYVNSLTLLFDKENSQIYTFLSNNKKYLLKIKDYIKNNEYELQKKAALLNISPRVFNRAILDNKEFIVMEYIDAITLNSYILNEEYENIRELYDVILKTLNCIRKLHSLNISHGDLNATNILISDKDDYTHNDAVFIIDFEYAHNITNSVEIEYDRMNFLHSINYFNEDTEKICKELGYKYSIYQKLFDDYFALLNKKI